MTSAFKQTTPRKKGIFARLLAWIARGAERSRKDGTGPCRS